MTPDEAAKIAFRKCSRANDNNRACAGFIARQMLISRGVKPTAVDLAEIERLLDKWFDALKPALTPAPIVTDIDDGNLPLIETQAVQADDSR